MLRPVASQATAMIARSQQGRGRNTLNRASGVKKELAKTLEDVNLSPRQVFEDIRLRIGYKQDKIGVRSWRSVTS